MFLLKYDISVKTFAVQPMFSIVSSYKDFPGGSDGKVPVYNAGDPGSIPGLGKISWRRKRQPTPVFLPGKFHGQRSMVGYIQSMGLQRVGPN